MLGALALLAVTSPVSVHVFSDADIAASARVVIAEQLTVAVRQSLLREVVLDPTPMPVACAATLACVRALGERMPADQRFFVRLFAGIRKVRVEVERVDARAAALGATSFDVDVKDAGWRTAMRTSIGAFLRVSLATAPPPAPVVVVEPAAPIDHVPPLILLGVGVAAGAVSLGLYSSSQASLQELNAQLVPVDPQTQRHVGIDYPGYIDALDSINTRRNVALGALVAGSAAVVGSIVYWAIASAD